MAFRKRNFPPSLFTGSSSTSLDQIPLQEIIVLVMGPTGAGKSSFINKLVGYDATVVGHKLTSCTDTIHAIPATFERNIALKNYRIVVVDTPGFDDTYKNDTVILKQIADWVKKAYEENRILGGVVYLHSINDNRFTGTCRRNLETFNKMCGQAALKKVIIGTTQWKKVFMEDGINREEELIDTHWSVMLKEGCRTKRFEDDQSSALGFIQLLVDNLMKDVFLQLQKELVDEKKILQETMAGKQLMSALQEVLQNEKKYPDKSQKAKDLTSQIKELKIPLSHKIKRLLRVL